MDKRDLSHPTVEEELERLFRNPPTTYTWKFKPPTDPDMAPYAEVYNKELDDKDKLVAYNYISNNNDIWNELSISIRTTEVMAYELSVCQTRVKQIKPDKWLEHCKYMAEKLIHPEINDKTAYTQKINDYLALSNLLRYDKKARQQALYRVKPSLTASDIFKYDISLTNPPPISSLYTEDDSYNFFIELLIKNIADGLLRWSKEQEGTVLFYKMTAQQGLDIMLNQRPDFVAQLRVIQNITGTKK